MQKKIWSALLVFTGWACTPSPPVLQLNNGLVIQHIRVISPERDTLADPSTVVLQGDSILYVGSDAVTLRGTFQTIDGQGKYLIPGLIDSHVHLTSVNGMSFEQAPQYPDLVREYDAQLPKSYLYFGFTTLIDLLTADEERMARLKAAPLRPDIYHAGSPAVVANGYPMHYVPPALRFNFFPNFLYLPGEAKNIPAQYSPEAHSPRAVVARIKQTGAIAVKTFYEPGFDRGPDQHRLPVPTPELLRDLKAATHEHHLRLTAHGNSLEAHQALTNAGVDIIAHGLWNWDRFYQADTLPAEIRQVLDQEIKQQIGYTPTLQVIEGLNALVTPAFLDDPQLGRVLPASLLAWYRTEAGQTFAHAMRGENTNEHMQQVYAHVNDHGRQALRYVAQHGGKILFGSDTPSAPTFGNPPGYNGYLEMQQMQAAGVPLRQILQSATLNNARAFGLDGDYGTIEPGKVANLLILDKNPLRDLSAYDAIRTVILRGRPIERGSLSIR